MFLLFGRKLQSTLRDPNSQISRTLEILRTAGRHVCRRPIRSPGGCPAVYFPGWRVDCNSCAHLPARRPGAPRDALVAWAPWLCRHFGNASSSLSYLLPWRSAAELPLITRFDILLSIQTRTDQPISSATLRECEQCGADQQSDDYIG